MDWVLLLPHSSRVPAVLSLGFCGVSHVPPVFGEFCSVFPLAVQNMQLGRLAMLNCPELWISVCMYVCMVPCQELTLYPLWIYPSCAQCSQQNLLIHHDLDQRKWYPKNFPNFGKTGGFPLWRFFISDSNCTLTKWGGKKILYESTIYFCIDLKNDVPSILLSNIH